MKVLMFGWEFPPYISGGLGTACEGLCEGFAADDDIEILFIVPVAHQQNSRVNFTLLGANSIPLSDETRKKLKELHIQFHPVGAQISAYGFTTLNYKIRAGNTVNIPTTSTQVNEPQFTGWYGHNLIQEVEQMNLLAEEIVQHHDFDVIHAHDWPTFPVAASVKALSDKPMVVHVHATEVDRSGKDVNPTVYEIEKKGMEQADAIIAVSKTTQKVVTKQYKQSPEKTKVVYNAVLPKFNKPDLTHKIWKGKQLVTFAGRITRQKGPQHFIDAAELILKYKPDIHFVMAGEGNLLPEMIELVAKKRIADHFHFTGFLSKNEMTQLLSISDVYVMPSVSEPFGITPLEAVQLGKPIIIPQKSGAAEVLKHAYCLKKFETKHLADSIVGILTHPVLAQTIVKNTHKELEEISWQATARKVKQVYKAVLANNQIKTI